MLILPFTHNLCSYNKDIVELGEIIQIPICSKAAHPINAPLNLDKKCCD